VAAHTRHEPRQDEREKDLPEESRPARPLDVRGLLQRLRKKSLRKKRGTARASTGTVRATRNMIRRVVRRRKRNRVTAVAARNAISPEAITTQPATARLLRK
jgi:hypothetical protein